MRWLTSQRTVGSLVSPGVVAVIWSVEIKNLRGIREGRLTDLRPLTVLVGPNGSGKSTVLEGILIGASPATTDAVVEVVRRHEAGGSSPRWVLWKAGQAGPTAISVTTLGGPSRQCSLELRRGMPESRTIVDVAVMPKGEDPVRGAVNGVKNKYESHLPIHAPFEGVPEVRLVEASPTGFEMPLHDLYTRAVRQGRRKEVFEIISEVVPGIVEIEILTENGEPILHFDFREHSVPASLAGDGIHSLLRLSLVLAASSGGVVLLEEPEVHQHPGAMCQSARAILAAVRRGIQVILTTHSLELIDSLVAASLDEDLDRTSLFRVLLQEGSLISSRMPGPDIAFSRTTIEDDVR